MPFLRHDQTLVFTSPREVITHYTTLIEELRTQLRKSTDDEHKTIRAELADQRQQLADHLKPFSPSQVDGYFTGAMQGAESDPELYALSHAYEAILVAEQTRIKVVLHWLRTT
ncbi:hypothetical protein [Spirosoma spitsbergense]|uniref:hypothetical protein n=1 Tax=Spirosoma spitsbergense TaxID=431554 RepID=UPI000362F04C|nr:hypothetical protein [Spirosoma spitsbergense]